MAPNSPLPAYRSIAQRLLKAGFTAEFARVVKTPEGEMQVTLHTRMSKAFNTFMPVKLVPDHRYLFSSREQIVAMGIPSEKFVVPTMVMADVEGDSILPFVRLPGAPGQRPWLYYTEVDGHLVPIIVKGKQDVTHGLEQHRYTNWNGVFFQRRTTGIRPTDYGVVPLQKDAWNELCNNLGMTAAQSKVVFNKAAKAVSHGHQPDPENVYQTLYDLQARDDSGVRVTRGLVDAICDFASTQQFAMSDAARVHRQNRLEEQVTDAMDELQDLVKGCGMATPLQSAAIEQWLYARMSHPHVLKVFTNPPANYCWEGPDAVAPSEVRGTARIEIEMEGHDTFKHGVVYDIELPAMTGEGCDFLHNNLEDLAASFFDYSDKPAQSRHFVARAPRAAAEAPSRSYFSAYGTQPTAVAPIAAPKQDPYIAEMSAPAPIATDTAEGQPPRFRHKTLSLSQPKQVAALLR